MATVALFWLVFWVILDARSRSEGARDRVTVCRDGDLASGDDALAGGTSARE